ncbi:hypothetical protein SDC9_97485 [bioreactor metagenome]|uniref:Uncharacterized protein n=1 Tax=bioreactor metagenome TaxID=1076179 RepID=A0A645AC20_9ZZZZ
MGNGEDSVTVDLFHVVEQVIKNTHCIVAHANLVQVRKADGRIQIHLRKVFLSIVELPTRIAGWILNHQQVIGDSIYNLHSIILVHGNVFAKLWYLFA